MLGNQEDNCGAAIVSYSRNTERYSLQWPIVSELEDGKKKSICLSLEYVDKLCHLPSSLFMLGHRTKFKTKIGGSHHNIKRPIVNVIKSPRQPIWHRPPSTKLYNLHCTGVVATATAAAATKNSYSTADSVKTTAPKITKSITIMQNCY